MPIMYRTTADSYRIEPFRVVRQTEVTVTYVDPRRYAKKAIQETRTSANHRWHGTWRDAHYYLMERNLTAIMDLEKELQARRDLQTRLEDLEPPCVTKVTACKGVL